MNEQIKTVIEHYTISSFQVAWISVVVSVVVSVATFFITNWLKNYFANKLLQRNLETEHTFTQRKKIKEVLAKYKVHLLTACEDLNHRCWNFANTYNNDWLVIKGTYGKEAYYFHSFIYRILVVFAWIKKIQKEMIYLDTTIASKEDLEFIKFLRIFPKIFCDLTFIEGKEADGNYSVDHFFKNKFELLPDCIIKDDGVKSYSEFIKNLTNTQVELTELFKYIDGISPTENRNRWTRLHLLHLTIIVFLNNYGYDFQQTNETKLEEVITKPKISPYLKNYFTLLNEYHLDQNVEIKKLEKIAKQYIEFH